MLTEGWDANNVTHVLGIRAFGTQLLCEQVIGRALRRQSYEQNEEGDNLIDLTTLDPQKNLAAKSSDLELWQLQSAD